MFSQNQSEVKLEWMYKGAQSSVDREDYLLGKSVDKSLEQLNTQEKQQQQQGVQQPKNHVEHECIPPSIRDYKEQIGEQVDINAKLQEDPLIAIKKQEEEKRRQFLNNPIQIKKLQKALKLQKSKKKKKRQKSKCDSEEELDKKLAKTLKSLKSSDILNSKSGKPKDKMLDTILMHKYNELKNQLSQNDLTDILAGKKDKSSSESSSEDEDSDNSRNKSKNRKKTEKDVNKFRQDKFKERRVNSYSEDVRKQSRNNSYRKDIRQDRYNSQKKARRDSSDSDDYRKEKERFRKNRNPEPHSSRRRPRSNDRESVGTKQLQDNRKYEASSDSDTDVRKKSWGLVRADGTNIPLSKRSSSNKMAQFKSDVHKDNKAVNYKKRERLTEEEKERRRQEMMQNASLRDKERASNLKVYRDVNSKEESQKEYNPDFLKKELLKSANNSSVESRIKANINNIQRSGNDMSRHFSKR